MTDYRVDTLPLFQGSGETCAMCRQPMPKRKSNGRRRYCSDACRQAAYRQRTPESPPGGITPEAGTSEKMAKKAPEEPKKALLSPAKESDRNASRGVCPQTVTNSPGRDGADFWLWMAPEQAQSWAAALADGVARFRSKERWRGQAPNCVKVHVSPDGAPSVTGDGLRPAALALGLVVVDDKHVAPGTYRLGIIEACSTEQASTP